MKVDLDALEAMAKVAAAISLAVPWWDADSALLAEANIPPDDRAHIAANSPDVTLALIARIRELEAELRRCAAILEMSDAAPPQAGPMMRADAVTEARALAAKGVTR